MTIGNDKILKENIQKICFSDPPFDCDRAVELERYFFNDQPAYYVKVNGFVIGNVPAEFVPILDENSDREYEIQDFHVYGGGNKKKFGAELKVMYK